MPTAIFPWGTLAVNLAGCLAIGVLAGLVSSRQLLGPEARRFAMIGVVGGFTTWSTFGLETVQLLRGAEYARAAGNVGLHLMLGLGLVWVGYLAAGGK